MCVLEKNVGLPEMHRKQKHVVAVSGRPIGYGKTRLVAGYQAAKAEQQKSRCRSEPREPVEPGMAGGASHMACMGSGLTSNNGCRLRHPAGVKWNFRLVAPLFFETEFFYQRRGTYVDNSITQC